MRHIFTQPHHRVPWLGTSPFFCCRNSPYSPFWLTLTHPSDVGWNFTFLVVSLASSNKLTSVFSWDQSVLRSASMLRISVQLGGCLSPYTVSVKKGGTRSESSGTGLYTIKRPSFIHWPGFYMALLCVRQCSLAEKTAQHMSTWTLPLKVRDQKKQITCIAALRDQWRNIQAGRRTTECNGFLRKKHSRTDGNKAQFFIQCLPNKNFLRT